MEVVGKSIDGINKEVRYIRYGGLQSPHLRRRKRKTPGGIYGKGERVQSREWIEGGERIDLCCDTTITMLKANI